MELQWTDCVCMLCVCQWNSLFNNDRMQHLDKIG